jgi:hypothetical protein
MNKEVFILIETLRLLLVDLSHQGGIEMSTTDWFDLRGQLKQ